MKAPRDRITNRDRRKIWTWLRENWAQTKDRFLDYDEDACQIIKKMYNGDLDRPVMAKHICQERKRLGLKFRKMKQKGDHKDYPMPGYAPEIKKYSTLSEIRGIRKALDIIATAVIQGKLHRELNDSFLMRE